MESVTPRGRALAAALRKARESTKLTAREAASRMGISHGAISHWETGRRMPRLEDVASFLAVLRITGVEREDILHLARNANDGNWLTVGIPGVAQQLAGVMECERTTTSIVEWSPLVIPGLLQTSDYARAVIEVGNPPRNEVETRVTMRIGRRDVLTRRQPATLSALIGEPALRQRIGGIEVMVDQLRHLLSPAPTVTIQVMPLGSGWHPGLMGPFIVYDFSKAPSIVYLEHHRTGAFVYDEDDVAGYHAAADTLRDEAMSPAHSKEFIAQLITELEAT